MLLSSGIALFLTLYVLRYLLDKNDAFVQYSVSQLVARVPPERI